MNQKNRTEIPCQRGRRENRDKRGTDGQWADTSCWSQAIEIEWFWPTEIEWAVAATAVCELQIPSAKQYVQLVSDGRASDLIVMY